LETDIRKAPVPFFLKPITRQIAAGVENQFIFPNLKTHFDYLESQLATSPDSGEFFCGSELTGADILMIMPLEASYGASRIDLTAEKYPKLAAFVERMHGREAYKRAVQKVEEATGEPFNMNFD